MKWGIWEGVFLSKETDTPWGAARRPVWLEWNMLGRVVAEVQGKLVDPQVNFGFCSKCDMKLLSGFM